MPSRTELPLKSLAYSNGEQQSLLPGGSGKSLCKLYASGHLEDFKATLRTTSGRDQDFLDVLDRALRAKDPAKEEFVEALIQKVDELGDVSDPKRDNRTPLWAAADASNLHAIRLLAPVGGDRERLARRLEAKDQFASTALHIAVVVACEDASDEKKEIVAWLLDRHRDCEVDANAQDQLGRPALYLAAKIGSLALVSEFLKHQRIGLDLVDEVNGGTPRAQILTRFPALEVELNARPVDVDMSLGDELQRLLEHADDADSLMEFCKKVAESDDGARALRHNCGDMSLMQQACHEGHRDAVDALMARMPALAATPVDPVNRTPPLLLAVAQGHADVLEVFRQRAPKQFHERTVDGDTVLINLVRHWDDEDERYYACLDLLLSEDYIELVDVNATNSESGDSALLLAALFRYTRVSTALLGAGAWLGGPNKRGYTPLEFVGHDTLQTHLDECVQSEGHPGDDERQIVFHYSCLRATATPAPAPRKSVTPHDVEAQRRAGEAPRREMEVLLGVSRSKELRPMLKHPVLNSFLDHKWQQMHMIFYVNAVLYALFVIFITWHILEAGGEPDTEANELTPGVYACVVIGFVCLTIRELAQALMDPLRYISEIENAMEVMLLVCSGFVIAHLQVTSLSWWREFAAATVLLAWGEFVLLLGRHPKFSTYVEMLKTVTWNFLKFLVWFAGLIVAFVLCFYTLFRNEPPEGDSKTNIFESLPLTAFKTIVMMTGELEAGNVPFDGLPNFSRPIFIVFVFIVVMVLLNLLNGLAVSDTQAIKDDAELVCCVSRVQMAERVESKLFDLLSATRHCCPCLTPLAEKMIRCTTVLPASDPKPKGRLMPNGDRVLNIDNPKPAAAVKPGQSALPPTDAVRPSVFCCLFTRLGVKKCISVSGKVVKRADAVLIARGASSALLDLEKRLLTKINEVTREMESRLSHRVEDVGREVANAIREALDQRTTQL